MAAKILHKKSNTVTNGVPSLPSPSILDYGEIAINYHEGNETISIKNDAGNIATFKTAEQIAETQAFEKTESSGTVSTLGDCTAASSYSFAVGQSTIAKNEGEAAVGTYNVSNTGSTVDNKTAYSVGIGTSATSRNALEVMRGGEVYVYGVGNYDGTNANNNESDPLQTYLEKNEYVIAASLNDLNSRCNELNNDITAITNSISSITSSMPDMSLYVPKSGTTMDKSSQLTFPGVRQENSITTIDSNGVSIDGDVYGNPNATLEANGVTFQDINNEYSAETSVSTNGVYIQLDDNSVNIGPEGLTVTFSGTSHSLSFPQTGGTIALTSDIPQPVSALTSACTHSEVPSAKVVYDTIVDNEYVVATAINTLHTEKEDVSNKVTAITSSATQTQYPSAKAVYDAIDGITGLPAVTAADNGKILKVVNGAWALVDPVTIYSGASAPSSDLGEDGDIYLQTN